MIRLTLKRYERLRRNLNQNKMIDELEKPTEKQNYIVLASYVLTDLTNMVNNKISEGYTLVGGISVSVNVQPNRNPAFRYCQAMYKE